MSLFGVILLTRRVRFFRSATLFLVNEIDNTIFDNAIKKATT